MTRVLLGLILLTTGVGKAVALGRSGVHAPEDQVYLAATIAELVLGASLPVGYRVLTTATLASFAFAGAAAGTVHAALSGSGKSSCSCLGIGDTPSLVVFVVQAVILCLLDLLIMGAPGDRNSSGTASQ